MRQRESQQEVQGYPLRRLSDKFWWLVQVSALVAILLASMKPQNHSGNVKSVSEELVHIPQQSFNSSVVRSFESSRPITITSRVVSLPVPQLRSPSSIKLDLEVETGQLRFEKNWTEAPRQPSSLKNGEDFWSLVQIHRKLNEGWESVALVQNHQKQNLGSVFVELDDGVNEFRVVFRDPQGHESSYPVVIRHVKKRAS